MNSAASNSNDLRTKWLLLVAAVTIYAAHFHETFRLFPVWPVTQFRGLVMPFTQYDHPFHFYYSWRTAATFAARRTFWYYDPTYMAGYAKTLVFPTSSTLAELAAIALPWQTGVAYRLVVALAVILTPAAIGLAARTAAATRSDRPLPALDGLGAAGLPGIAAQVQPRLGSVAGCACPAPARAKQLGRSALFCGAVLAVLWLWLSHPVDYLRWGMWAFILTTATSLAAALLFAAWLDTGRWRCFVLAGLLAAFSVVGHPSSLVTIGLMTAPAYLACCRRLPPSKHLAVWSLPMVMALVWSPWWLPTLMLIDTLGTTASGFINPNVGDRMLELLLAQYPVQSALWLSLLGCSAGLAGLGRGTKVAIASGVVSFFSLGYLAGGVPGLWFLQPGRYTQPLYALLVVCATVAWPEVIGRWRTARPLRRTLSLLTGSSAGALVLLTCIDYCLRPAEPLRQELAPAIVKLVNWLERHTDGSGRIMFEDRGRFLLPGRLPPAAYDPFPDTNPSPLLPLLVPRQYIGGPYLYTHLVTNFTQVGDASAFGQDAWMMAPERLLDYVHMYNIKWAVLWSVPMLRLAGALPNLFEWKATFGHWRVFQLNRKGNWAISGYAEVSAKPDRLEVHAARPGNSGTLILSYHWLPTLQSSVPLEPLQVADDPAPFIAVPNPPKHFVIENTGLWPRRQASPDRGNEM